LANLVYAVLAERADADDRAELARWAYVTDADRPELCRNRDRLDEWLSEPTGLQAVGEAALLRELGGAA
jgi:hypothetical protein